MNQYDYDLAYLTRQREETLVKLAKIEEKIQKLRGPPKSFWSTVKTFFSKTYSNFAAFIARAFTRPTPDSTKAGDLPTVIVTDVSEKTPLLSRMTAVNPSNSFLQDIFTREKTTTTPAAARRRPASLGALTPACRLQLAPSPAWMENIASATPVPATPTFHETEHSSINFTPALKLLHPSPAWRTNLLASASPLPRSAATPQHCQDW